MEELALFEVVATEPQPQWWLKNKTTSTIYNFQDLVKIYERAGLCKTTCIPVQLGTAPQ